MTSLYEIGSDLSRIVDDVTVLLENGVSPDDERVQGLLSKMVEQEEDWDRKAINVAKYLRHLESDQDQVKAEIERLHKKLKSYNSAYQNLHDLLLFQMLQFGKKEIKNPILSIKVRDNPMSVIIENEDAVPIAYKKEKVTVSVDKTAIKKAFQVGETVEGVNIVNSQRLEIK